jgi:hypothetical protein
MFGQSLEFGGIAAGVIPLQDMFGNYYKASVSAQPSRNPPRVYGFVWFDFTPQGSTTTANTIFVASTSADMTQGRQTLVNFGNHTGSTSWGQYAANIYTCTNTSGSAPYCPGNWFRFESYDVNNPSNTAFSPAYANWF